MSAWVNIFCFNFFFDETVTIKNYMKWFTAHWLYAKILKDYIRYGFKWVLMGRKETLKYFQKYRIFQSKKRNAK